MSAYRRDDKLTAHVNVSAAERDKVDTVNHTIWIIAQKYQSHDTKEN